MDEAERCAEVGLPTTCFAGMVGEADVVGEAITVVGAEHEADSDGSRAQRGVVVGMFFLKNNEKNSQYNYKHDDKQHRHI